MSDANRASYSIPWPAHWTRGQYLAALRQRVAELRRSAQEARAKAIQQDAEADGLTFMAEEVERT